MSLPASAPMSELDPPRRPAIRAQSISKTYGEHTVVDDMSLEVAEGEVVSIIGPSGAGKTTFLRCLNLLETPDTGHLQIGGLDLDLSRPPAKRELAALRRTAGMVFQSFNLFPHMTVLRNVSLPQQRVLGLGRDEADARSLALLERVGVGDKATQYPGRCSGGQQQRVAIARALALEPRVMLFDEPTSALDPEVGLEVLAVMKELAAAGTTMVIVTHEMSFARDVSDHLVVMADGGLLEAGDPKVIFSEPAHERTRTFLRAVLGR
ncbi:amino acid ABC transporter ATP-binding protein [Amycolatopsis jejuensis]|uniref:amino acid ABC transporter ATP-binding protein n=1 Tax=Amycolatopsis jejuensis TaxID=330084 RepID=UPI000B16D4A4|nr:amino acid ABC transporter ATP-binding protein [Amycolatopsis jejuensis]